MSLAAQGQDNDKEPPPLTGEQLEQLVAPIALHPDALLSQILMASTYPLEVVEAARWVKANPNVGDEKLEAAMVDQPWDASVKSLAAFPQVLEMMNAELSWTQQLGDAFLAQQKDILDAVQRLRLKADKEKTLETTKQQVVKKEPVSSGSSSQQVIVIEPAQPEVIYVPAYNPTVVYGTWAYPAYPPYYWYPPGYVASRALWFAAGVAVGRALWGRCNWRRGSVSINVNRYNSFNRTNIRNPSWSHNPRHRRAVPYRNRDVAKKYGRKRGDIASREQFRGRAEAGRRDLKAGKVRPGTGLDGKRPGGDRPGAGQRPGKDRPGAGQRPGKDRPSTGQRPSKDRPSAGKRPASRPAGGSKRPATTKKRPASRPAKQTRPKSRPSRSRSKRSASAYRGVGRGNQVRRSSSRGHRSRSASRSRGGGRGGGGRRGGGRRR